MDINCTPIPQHREKIIRIAAAGLLNSRNSEREALSVFLWKLSDLEPPVSPAEQSYFCALYRMNQSYTYHTPKSVNSALRLLNIHPESVKSYSARKLLKTVKLAYWKQYNELTGTPHLFLTHARILGVKKKAYDFLAGCVSGIGNEPE